ncbi:diaminopimelate epimerase [Motiliproteus coralliicola]|uniref:Diaminopimelate epimerase n=1 Tax=Motiliproteus coralliicola TaxID=2283196 RepID=A0A369WC27_9GAMM|nr:diaminopimelate epimerase [Motiliproteus coralliicola]RDE18729.1 diaminopimelate epimerase [Motiliproteus coralliicola]
MQVRFTKMHGLGNDFMVVDLITQRARFTPERVRELSDRNFGIGFDQLLLVETPTDPEMDFKYRIYNADGSEVENCGNGARCFARFVTRKRLTGKQTIAVQTAKGPLYLSLVDDDKVRVDMGEPVLKPERIPFQAEQQAAEYPVEVNGQLYQVGAVSMGNPHGVLRIDSVDSAPVETLGPALESHPSFPERANIGFMEIIDRNNIRLRVFERGAGETLACGTGACAAVVSGQLRGWLDSDVCVQLPGGKVDIHWNGYGSSVIMTGTADTVYEGRVQL